MANIYIGPEPPFGAAPPKQANRPPPTPEEVAETAALAEAMLAVQNSKRPTDRQLSRLAAHLRKNPERRRHPAMDPFLNIILDRFVDEHEPSEPGSVAKGIMVEVWDRDKTASSLRKARRRVATFFRISASRLKEACLEFQRKYRR